MTTENIDGLNESLEKLGKIAREVRVRSADVDDEIKSYGDDALGLAALLKKLREDYVEALKEKSQMEEIRRMAQSLLQPTPPKKTEGPKPAPQPTPPKKTEGPKPAPQPTPPKKKAAPSATATAVAINGGGGFATWISTIGVAIFVAVAAFVSTLLIWTFGIAPDAHGSAEWAGSPWAALLIAALVGGGVFFLAHRRNS